MLNRRRFIEGTAGITGMAVASRSWALDPSLRPGAIELVLCDPRYRCSVLFAEQLVMAGATAVTLDRDIGVLWTGELAARFTSARGALAGMTLYSDLHISQVFARSYVRTYQPFEAMHDARGSNSLRHSLRASKRDADRFVAADFDQASWPQRLATKLGEGFDPEPMREARSFAGAPRPTAFPGTLFSWVIARA